jgi:peptide/nickel transport system substrate-binding protein
VANKDYYEGRPSLDGVIFYYQPDKEESWARLLSGQTDIAQEISPKNYTMMRQYEKKYYFNLYTMNSHYTILLYNTTDPLFSNPNVRLALSHAIDKEHIVEKILEGCGVAANSPMGVISPYHNPKVKPISYNPQKALELLKEAGWSYDKDSGYLNKEGESFEFRILVRKESPIEKKVAQYIMLCLNDLGIKVRLQFLPLRELKEKYFRNNQFQAVVTDLSTIGHAPEVLKSTWCPYLEKKSEAGCFDHPEVTTLIYKALDEKGPSKQNELFYEIDALITSLQPGTFLFQKTAIDVMSKRLIITHPFSLTYQGIYRLKYAALNQN